MNDRGVSRSVADGSEGLAVGSFGVEVRRGHRQASWTGPECPDCGGTQTPVRTSGRDRHGRLLQDRRCRECGTIFVTIQHVLPVEIKFADLDVEHRRRKRESKRRRFGWTEHQGAQRREDRVPWYIGFTVRRSRSQP